MDRDRPFLGNEYEEKELGGLGIFFFTLDCS